MCIPCSKEARKYSVTLYIIRQSQWAIIKTNKTSIQIMILTMQIMILTMQIIWISCKCDPLSVPSPSAITILYNTYKSGY